MKLHESTSHVYVVPTYYCSCCSDKLAEREAVGIRGLRAGEWVASYMYLGHAIWPGYEAGTCVVSYPGHVMVSV